MKYGLSFVAVGMATSLFLAISFILCALIWVPLHNDYIERV